MQLSLVLFAMFVESWAVSVQCDWSTNIMFSVSSWRNESGHRLVAADVQSDTNRVDLTVELLSEKCGGSRSVVLKTLSSTGQPEEQTSVSSTAAPTAAPLPGYHHIPGFGYYNKLPISMSWKDGVEACRREGTHMLLLESQEEIDALYGWTGCCPWVGVYRESSSGPWINVLGQQMNHTDFFGWLPDYPSGRGDCMITGSTSRKGTHNYPCTIPWDIVCEQML